MRSLGVVALVAIVGCSTPHKSYQAHHSDTYQELPEAPPFAPKPHDPAPSVQRIQADVADIAYETAPNYDAVKIEYEGKQGRPPHVRDQAPVVVNGSLPVVRDMRHFRGPVYSIVESQPTYVAHAWINYGLGFRRYELHYVAGQLVHVNGPAPEPSKHINLVNQLK